MGVPIKNISADGTVSKTDYLVGTDFETGKTYNYIIEDIISLVEAVAGGISNTANIKTVTETATKTWDQILNELVSPWVVDTADVPILLVNDVSSDFKALYIYKKSSIVQIRIGVDETQVTTDDFIVLRQASDFGEANTATNQGSPDGLSRFGVYATKIAGALQFKSLKEGSNIAITDSSGSLEIAVDGSLGETNTATSLGGVDVYKEKVGSDLKFRGLRGTNCTVGTSGENEIYIQPWGKIKRTASFTISSTDAQRTIHIDNGATPVVITVPDTLGTGFEMCVQQIGTGEVSFVASGTASLEYSANKLKGQGATCLVETLADDTDRVLVTGGVKV